MVRVSEQGNTTNPAAERRFDSKVIFAFIAGAILLILVFLFVGSRLLPSRTANPQSNSSQTQESDKRAAP